MIGMSSQVLGVFAAAILAAATIYAVGHTARRLGRPLPRWAMPFTIAAAMIGFTVWNDYDWFPRLRAQLPPSVQVLGQGTGLQAMRPWTFVVPVTTRFRAMDRATVSRTGDIAQGTVLFVERGQKTRAATLEFDCRGMRMRGMGRAGTDWLPVPAEDTAYRVACDGQRLRGGRTTRRPSQANRGARTRRNARC